MISAPGLPPATKADRLRALLARCHDDPGLFAAAILGAKGFDPGTRGSSPFWWRQEQISQLVVNHHTCIFPWGNALGKSWWAARLALWWAGTRVNSLVITTAPTYDQLDSVLWKNIRQAVDSSLVPLGFKMSRKPLRASLGNEWGLLGVATTKVERMSGHHNKNLFFLGDEASGILPEIYEAADSLVPRKKVLIGNPIRYEGIFREAYEQALEESRDESIPAEERAVALVVPSTDSPDLDADRSDRGLACGAWLRAMARKYGRHSLWWRTHVDALFPEASTAGLIPPAWLDPCTSDSLKSLRASHRGGRKALACDLGEGVGKDRTVILVRDELGVLEVVADNRMGLDEAAAEIARLAAKWRVPEERVSYDALGIGKKLRPKLAGNGIEKALAYKGSAGGFKDYTNLRTACGWAAHRRLDPDWTASPTDPKQLPFHIPAGPWWPQMREEILAVEYRLDGTKSALESKEDLKDRLGRSPDLGDSFFQSFACDVLGRKGA
jgi:phage terminase large subunit